MTWPDRQSSSRGTRIGLAGPIRAALTAVGVAWTLGATAGAEAQSASWVFMDVTVIDGRGTPAQPGRAVLVQDGRITWIGPTSQVDVPADVLEIPATGRFLIPGLWDMHVHPDDPEIWELIDPPAHLRDLFMPNFVAWGVTGVRDTGGRWDVIQDWRRRIDAGELVGPQIVSGGPLIDGPDPAWPGSVAVLGAEDGRAAVDSLIGEGVDFIKVYSRLPRDAFFAITDRAHERGFQVVGHVPNAVTLEDALAVGMDDQHHLLKMPQAFSGWNEVTALLDDAGFTEGHPRRGLEAARLAGERYDTAQANDYYRRMADQEIWVTPTLVVWRRNAYYEPNDPSVRDWLPYVPEYLRTWWTPEVNVHLRNRTPESIGTLRTYYQTWMRIAGEVHSSGVRVLAGSDTGGNPHLIPGLSLHEELELLVEAGLTATEALQAATINPAIFMGMQDEVGSVEVGKRADLVLLGADPLEHIRNTREIVGVMVGGDYLDADGRAGLLEQIRNAAR